MARGEIPNSNFYIVSGKSTNGIESVKVNLVTPTEQAVEQAKVEIRSQPKKTIRGIKRHHENDYIFDAKKKKGIPPGIKRV